MLSTKHAFDRLSIPATERDLVRQFVCLECNFCMAVAWLTWHTLFSNPASADAPLDARDDLMGVFTTDPNIVQKLFHVGIPVWYMRRSESHGPGDVIISTVDIQNPIQIILHSGDYSDHPVYIGPPGIKQLEAVCYKGHMYTDLEPIPFPTNYKIIEDVAHGGRDSTQSAASHQSGLLNTNRSVYNPVRTIKLPMTLELLTDNE